MADQGYQGPGKFFSTIGGWFAGGAIGSFIGIAMLVVLPVTSVFYAALAIGLVGHIVGAYQGYQYAAEGERQYETLRMQAESRLQKTCDEPYSQQVGTKRFTDHIQSNAVQGNYADTVLADRGNDAHQAR